MIRYLINDKGINKEVDPINLINIDNSLLNLWVMEDKDSKIAKLKTMFRDGKVETPFRRKFYYAKLNSPSMFFNGLDFTIPEQSLKSYFIERDIFYSVRKLKIISIKNNSSIIFINVFIYCIIVLLYYDK